MLPHDETESPEELKRAKYAEYRKAYRKTEKGKAAYLRYNRSEKAKATRARYIASEKGKATIARNQARQAERRKGMPRKSYGDPETRRRWAREYRKRPEVKARAKVKEKKRQIRKATNGLCPRCSRPKVQGKSRCEVHLAYAAKWKAVKEGRLPATPESTVTV